MNDYILEAADITNVSVSDIELTQLFAEAAVLEAMMNCYEKQIALMEYNEEAAEEIMMETSYLPSKVNPDDTLPNKVESNDTNKKSKMKAFLHFISRIGNTIAKLGAKIVDFLTKTKFDKIADALEKTDDISKVYNRPEVPEINIIDCNAMLNIELLIKTVDEYQRKYGDVQKMNKEMNPAVAKSYTNDIQKMTADLDKVIKPLNRDKNAPDNFHKNPETREKLIKFCKRFGDNTLKKQIREFGQASAKFNTDYAEDNLLPPELTNAMRKFYKALLKFYTHAARALKFITSYYIGNDAGLKAGGGYDAAKALDEAKADPWADEDIIVDLGESYNMNLTDSDYDYYAESTRGEIRKHDFLSWLIGWTGARYNPDNTWDFHWPKLVLSLLGMSQVAGIWAMIENYKAMRENIDDIINVEIVKIASAVLDDLKTDANGTSVNTTLSKFKKDLKELIKECKNDEKMGKSNELRSKVSDLRTAAERVLTNPKDNENLQSLVNAINAIFEKCIDKSKLPKSKNSAKTESYNMNLSEDEDFF